MTRKDSALSNIEREVKKEENRLKEEVKKEEKGLKWFFRSHTFKIIVAVVLLFVINSVIIYLSVTHGRLLVESSEISAPVISLSSQTQGVLDGVYVKEGDIIPAGTVVAQVDGNPIKSTIQGLVIFVQDTPGQIVNSQIAVVKMIDINELRLVSHIEENKGLNEIKQGQNVIFTVDAFGSRQFQGVVESISSAPTSQDIVFSISDNRQEKQFDVKIKYNLDSYPELKYGMSARAWIYK